MFAFAARALCCITRIHNTPPLHQATSLSQECNSIETIKAAVEANLGVAFVSRAAISKEVGIGCLCALTIRGVVLQRMLSVVTDPSRYCSNAVRAFLREMFGLNTCTAAFGAVGDGVVSRHGMGHALGHVHVLLTHCCMQ